MTRKPQHITASSRAARLVAGVHANPYSDDAFKPLQEARQAGQLFELAIALALHCVQLAQELHGDNAQAALDQFAFSALIYEERVRSADPLT